MYKTITFIVVLILAANALSQAPKKKDRPTYIDPETKYKYAVSDSDVLMVQRFGADGSLHYKIPSEQILAMLPKEQRKGAKIIEISPISDNPKCIRIVVVQKDRFDLITEKTGKIVEVISPKK